MADRCRRCGRPLTNPDSTDLGYGPDCAAALGLTLGDRLPQRCECCHRSQGALRLLYGVWLVKHIERYEGSTGWVDIATGEIVYLRG